MRTALLQVFAAKDTAEQTLSLLPLSSLGALLCTCRSLRALLVDTPSIWQAAAVREHPNHHQLHQSEDPPGYLQRQHLAHASIAAHRCRFVRKRIYNHQKLVLSPNGCRHVHLAADGQLHVYSTMTGQLLHSWLLPDKIFRPITTWGWDLISTAVLLPFGPAWDSLNGFLPGAHEQSYSTSSEDTGFILVEADTGAIVTVILPRLKDRQYVLSPIFAEQYVLVPDREGERRYLWVYTRDGQRICSFDRPGGSCLPEPLWWAPGGEVTYLLHHDSPQFMWRPATGACVSITWDVWYPCKSPWAAWAPSADILLMTDRSGRVVFINDQGSHVRAPQQLNFDSHTCCWGHRGDVALAGQDQIRLYAVEDFILVLRHTIRKMPSIYLLALSPGATHVAALSTSSRAIISIATGQLREWRQTGLTASIMGLAWPLPEVIVHSIQEVGSSASQEVIFCQFA